MFLGEKCKTIKTNSTDKDIIIDTQDLQKGSYIIRLNNQDRVKMVK